MHTHTQRLDMEVGWLAEKECNISIPRNTDKLGVKEWTCRFCLKYWLDVFTCTCSWPLVKVPSPKHRLILILSNSQCTTGQTIFTYHSAKLNESQWKTNREISPLKWQGSKHHQTYSHVINIFTCTWHGKGPVHLVYEKARFGQNGMA